MKLSFIPNPQSHSGKGWYTLTFPYNQADVQLARQCGFRWNPGDVSLPYLPPRVWWTTDLQVAAKLIKFADDACRLHMQGMMRNEARGNVELKLGQDSRGKLIFRCFCPMSLARIPDSAGFRWHAKGQCYTARPIWCALMLKQYADPACLAVLDREEERMRENLPRSIATKSWTGFDPPAPEGRAYDDHQKAAIEYCLLHKRVVLSDTMGLGKTIEFAGLLNALHDQARRGEREPIRNVLLICKASLQYQMKAELRRWLLDRGMAILIADGDRLPVAHGILETGRVVIVSFHSLHKYRDEMRRERWDVLCIDEHTLIKKPSTRMGKMVYGYAEKPDGERRVVYPPLTAEYMLSMSGTLIENRMKESYPILSFTCPDYWEGKGPFFKVFSNDAKQLGSNTRSFKQILYGGPHMARTQEMVFKDMPPLRRKLIPVPAEAGMLRREVDLARGYMPAIEEYVKRLEAVADVDDLRHFGGRIGSAENAKLFSTLGHLSSILRETELLMAPIAAKYVQEGLDAGAEKCVAFGMHVEALEKFHRSFGKRSVLIYGDTDKRIRNDLAEQFTNDPHTQVFTGSMTAAGQGYNCQVANWMVMFGFSWVPGIITQCEYRIKRRGQKRGCVVDYLVFKGSIMERVLEVVIEKLDVIIQATAPPEMWESISELAVAA